MGQKQRNNNRKKLHKNNRWLWTLWMTNKQFLFHTGSHVHSLLHSVLSLSISFPPFSTNFCFSPARPPFNYYRQLDFASLSFARVLHWNCVFRYVGYFLQLRSTQYQLRHMCCHKTNQSDGIWHFLQTNRVTHIQTPSDRMCVWERGRNLTQISSFGVLLSKNSVRVTVWQQNTHSYTQQKVFDISFSLAAGWFSHCFFSNRMCDLGYCTRIRATNDTSILSKT